MARRVAFHSLEVRAVERLTDDSVALTFRVPPQLAEAYRFTAGQHLTVRGGSGGDDLRRSYSICLPAVPTAGSPWPEELRVAVKRLPGGVFSTYAFEQLRPGDVLDVMTPSGRFTLSPEPGRARHYCALAAGSGITPIIAILATALEVEAASSATLVYGNRTSGSIMFLEELEDLKNRYVGRFHLVHVLSREQQEAGLLNGRIDRPRLAAILDTLVFPDTVDEWFLCGPVGMIEAAQATLVDHGVDISRVHSELFHVGPAPSPPVGPQGTAPGSRGAGGADEAEVTIVLDRRASSFALAPAGISLLDATLAVRGDAPYACKNGMCGTCRAKVLEGRVEMDQNYALEPEEVAAGFVLACQAHPRSARVILDFDA